MTQTDSKLWLMACYMCNKATMCMPPSPTYPRFFFFKKSKISFEYLTVSLCKKSSLFLYYKPICCLIKYYLLTQDSSHYRTINPIKLTKKNKNVLKTLFFTMLNLDKLAKQKKNHPPHHPNPEQLSFSEQKRSL